MFFLLVLLTHLRSSHLCLSQIKEFFFMPDVKHSSELILQLLCVKLSCVYSLLYVQL